MAGYYSRRGGLGRLSLWKTIVLSVVLLAAGAGIAYVYTSKKSGNKTDQGSIASANGDLSTAAGVAQAVSRIIDLPKDEEPALIDVKDASKLAQIPFLSQAKNGDKVLVYQQSGKGYIYRPSTGKLVASGNVKLQ